MHTNSNLVHARQTTSTHLQAGLWKAVAQLNQWKQKNKEWRIDKLCIDLETACTNMDTKILTPILTQLVLLFFVVVVFGRLFM